ncbi:MAG: polyphenol oxidase family protein [Patescibacteria group bacterium]
MSNYIITPDNNFVLYKNSPFKCGITTRALGDFSVNGNRDEQIINLMSILGVTSCISMLPEHKSNIILLNNIINQIEVSDCDSILFRDKQNGFQGLVHCGWRSILDKVVEKTIAKLLGCGYQKPKIGAIIYTGICANCYEVNKDVYVKFREDPIAREFFTYQEKYNNFSFNLPELLFQKLHDTGLKSENLNFFNLCSHCLKQNNRFLLFSERRTEDKGKRNLAFIKINDIVIAGTTGNCPYIIFYLIPQNK